ncbi:MAG TPA: DUF86 domain-containing protein [Spirochaetota bacterium]|nr:DUF86 domain-containing protein [Spirochaetota bacterium]
MVNRDTVEKAIETISLNVKELRRADDIDWNKYRTDIRARRFVERSLQVIIEACLDIAHHIISDDGMREPVSYRDAFAVLGENGILPQGEIDKYEKIAMFRNLLVHYYEKVDDEIVFGIFRKNLGDFDGFVGHVLAYLERS